MKLAEIVHAADFGAEAVGVVSAAFFLGVGKDRLVVLGERPDDGAVNRRVPPVVLVEHLLAFVGHVQDSFFAEKMGIEDELVKQPAHDLAYDQRRTVVRFLGLNRGFDLLDEVVIQIGILFHIYLPPPKTVYHNWKIKSNLCRC